MAEDVRPQEDTTTTENQEDLTADTLEEFSIFELDDRLEFVAWCDGNCVCTGGGAS